MPDDVSILKVTTVEEYWARVRNAGWRRMQRVGKGWGAINREGEITVIADPTYLSPEARAAYLECLGW